MSKTVKINTVELFAGVGGFRIGLERASDKYNVIWSNQWEPSTKKQEASDIYVKRFGSLGHSNEDIAQVRTSDIPDHDLLVGGFPCQDYSVARTLNQSEGIQGKKGVLWWEIYRILAEKTNKPKYLFFENVDRLLKSPAKQRGKDFAIMLASLSDLGYIVEWRVINAADYGMPQRRRRVFFLGYYVGSKIAKSISKMNQPIDWVLEKGVLAKTFEVVPKSSQTANSFQLDGDLSTLTLEFNKGGKDSPFGNAGVMINRNVYTIDTKPQYNGRHILLGDIILLNGAVPNEYYIDNDSLEKWQYLKGAKNEKRYNQKGGFEYNYNEGAMVFPDPLNKPSRTIITGEGGASPSRFKHVIKTREGKLRRLTPIELERLNMFPDNHTEGASDVRRAFFMGNALVVGVIEKIATSLLEHM